METKTIDNHVSESIRWLEDLDRDALADAGGKGANLGELINAGLPVPPGFVVTASAYRTVLEVGGLRERIARRLRELVTQEPEAIAAASRDISAWMAAAPVPEAIRADIARAYAALAER